MSATLSLPKPRLELVEFGSISVLTDNALAEAIGVRVAFTGREGGSSEGAFASLNLGSHVNDDCERVQENRRLLLSALGCEDVSVIVPNQVHGDVVTVVDDSDPSCIALARERAAVGSDGLLVSACDVAALLCFADCAPVIIVSPSGRFAVVHAGWRGAVSGVAGKAARMLCSLDAQGAGGEDSDRAISREYNAYIGPFIHFECFETGHEVTARFVEKFGACCAPDSRHVDLFAALRVDLARAGLSGDRIVEAGVCTMCNADAYFSYRASGGKCGRHGAFAVRRNVL